MTSVTHVSDAPRLASRAQAAGWDTRLLTVTAGGFTAFLNLYAPQSLLPTLSDSFQAGHQAVSQTVTAATLAFALASPLAGTLVGRFGRRRLVAVSILGVVLATILCAAAPTLPSLVALRFVQGLFLPLIVAVMMSFVGDEWPEHEVGRAMSVYVAWTVIGGFCGRFFSGLVTAWFGWRVSLLLLAGMLLAGGALILAFLPERRGARTGLETAGAGPVLAGLWEHFRHPGLVQAFASGFNVLFAMVATFTYIGFHLAAPPFELGPDALGAIFFVYLVGMIVTPLAGRLADRVGFRGTFVRATLVSAAGLLLTLVPSLPAVITGLALCCTGGFASQVAASSYISRAAGEQRASALGVYMAWYYLGGSTGAAVTGFFWHLGAWPACVAFIGCVHLLTLALSSHSVPADRVDGARKGAVALAGQG